MVRNCGCPLVGLAANVCRARLITKKITPHEAWSLIVSLGRIWLFQVKRESVSTLYDLEQDSLICRKPSGLGERFHQE
ncbi:MAG: hypothetical protein KAI41_07335, partial [Hyphomicrobiaceae bacterium]|nr:hypothetical protein [Hyphomicrobiaceae bacterium]